MANIIIRNLDDQVKRQLRVRAAENGRSMEAEAREILAIAVQEPSTAYQTTPAQQLRGRWKGRIRTEDVLKHTREL